MTLKKNDKIIAIVGVLILIVAAIGIFYYVDMDNKVDDEEPEEKENEFIVACSTVEDRPTVPDPDPSGAIVRDKLIGAEIYEGTISVSKEHLCEIEIFVSYEDNLYGLLGGKILPQSGADTLTIQVLDENDKEIKTVSLVGMDNTSIKISGLSKMITPESIKAETFEEANELLQERYYGDEPVQANYKVVVSVSNGESILRPIAWLREKLFLKDTFDMSVTYDFYEYTIEEETSENPNDTEPKEPSAKIEFSSTPYSTAALGGI